MSLPSAPSVPLGPMTVCGAIASSRPTAPSQPWCPSPWDGSLPTRLFTLGDGYGLASPADRAMPISIPSNAMPTFLSDDHLKIAAAHIVRRYDSRVATDGIHSRERR